jgi:hypothetical protein
MLRKKRSVPFLLTITALLGLMASACCFDPYYNHHRGHRGHRYASAEAPVATVPAR